jgi:AraC-like DNA-binding protein
MRQPLLHILGMVALLVAFVSCKASPAEVPDPVEEAKKLSLNWILPLERAFTEAGAYASALSTIGQGEQRALELGDEKLARQLRFDRGYVLVKSGNPDEGLPVMESFIEELTASSNRNGIAANLGFLADAYATLGRYEDAIDTYMKRLDLMDQMYEEESNVTWMDAQYHRTTRELARLLALSGQADSLRIAPADSVDLVNGDQLSRATRYISQHHLRQKRAEVERKERKVRQILLLTAFAVLALLMVTLLLLRVLRDSRRLSQKNRQLVSSLEAVNEYRKEVARLKEDATDSDEWKRSAQQVSDAELLGRMDTLMEQEALYKDSGLNLKTIAQALSVPQSRLEALFRNLPDAEGLSDYLNRKRLVYACKLLKENPYLKVAAVCEAAGFTSLSVFQRYFKKEMGMTAAEYRAAVRPE